MQTIITSLILFVNMFCLNISLSSSTGRYSCDDSWRLHSEDCYQASSLQLTWFKAGVKCRQSKAELTNIKDEAERTFLKTLMERNKLYWTRRMCTRQRHWQHWNCHLSVATESSLSRDIVDVTCTVFAVTGNQQIGCLGPSYFICKKAATIVASISSTATPADTTYGSTSGESHTKMFPMDVITQIVAHKNAPQLGEQHTLDAPQHYVIVIAGVVAVATIMTVIVVVLVKRRKKITTHQPANVTTPSQPPPQTVEGICFNITNSTLAFGDVHSQINKSRTDCSDLEIRDNPTYDICRDNVSSSQENGTTKHGVPTCVSSKSSHSNAWVEASHPACSPNTPDLDGSEYVVYEEVSDLPPCTAETYLPDDVEMHDNPVYMSA